MVDKRFLEFSVKNLIAIVTPAFMVVIAPVIMEYHAEYKRHYKCLVSIIQCLVCLSTVNSATTIIDRFSVKATIMMDVMQNL